MEVEVSAEAKDKKLNRMVAITVAILSVVMGLCNIKDGNLVQNMQQAQSQSVDIWNEYQAARLKLHTSEAARAEIALIAGPHPSAEAQAALQHLDTDIAKYTREAPQLRAQAQGHSDDYDAMNLHDDQFDAGEAAMSTAIAMAAVASLADSFWLLYLGWVFGVFGMFMGLCGFAHWSFHPDILSTFLG